MKYLRNALFVGLFLLTAACTSSNSSQSQQTNNNYDREFREQTRSSSQNYQQGQQLDEEAEGDPIVSLMLVAMETGDVHPGEDYYVFAVADKPRERDDIEYVWSIANGDIHEVEESERGRLETIVETEYATASSGGQAPVGTADQPTGEGAVGGTPGAGGIPGTNGSGSQGSGSPSAGGGTGDTGWQPGSGGSDPSGGKPPGDIPIGLSPDDPLSGGGVVPPIDIPPGLTVSSAGGPTDKENEKDIEAGDKEKVEPKPEGTDGTEGKDSSGTGEPKKDDGTGGETEKTEPKKEETGNVGFVLEQRVIAGPEDETEEEEEEEEEKEGTEGTGEDTDSETAESITEGKLSLDVRDAAARVASLSTQVRPGQAAESSATGEASAFGSTDEPVLGGDGNLLRYEYETWKENGNEKNRRPLAGYGDGRESERLTWDESSEDFEFATDDPYILWTPEIPGETSIFVQIRYKNDILTDPKELQVSVRLKDPAVSLSEDFPDVVREDEAVYLELNAENIPAFDKGLFTIQFDPIKLSFRDAELGGFFDDSPASSIYFAQPDKSQGRVLLAVDTNTNILDISGDGVLAYIKFKAKEDLKEREETGLMLIADTSARYILNKNGENVLPLPVQNPPFRTSTVMPPEQPGFDRDSTPGEDAPAQNAGAGQAGQNQGSRPGGNRPATNQTYGAGMATAPAGTPPPSTPAPIVGDPPPTGGGKPPPASTPPPVVPPPPVDDGGIAPGLVMGYGLWPPEGLPTYYRQMAAAGSDSEWFAGTFSGSGQMDSEYFYLDEGLVIVTFNLLNSGLASAELKDSNGVRVGPLSSTIGSRGFSVKAPGDYVFEVVADFDWEISLWQPRVQAATQERSFKGKMTAATVFTTLPRGLNSFVLSHNGAENFSVLLLNYEGVAIKQLVNTVGIYNDVVDFEVPEDGLYLFDVIAFDEWTIEID